MEDQTNFHFSFATKNLMHTKGRIKTEEYLRYWQRNVDSLRQIKRDEFRDFFERMLEMGIVLADDFSVFKADVLDTNRNFVNVCPGIYMEFKWDKEQAIKTDARDQFVEEVRDKIEDALQALGIKN